MAYTAILIDPETREFREVSISKTNELNQMYELIGCDLVEAARVLPPNATRDVIFIDEEGMINGHPKAFFWVKGSQTPLAGKGLVIGSDSRGNYISPSTTLEWLHENVVFVSRSPIGGWLWAPHGATMAEVISTREFLKRCDAE